MILIQNFEPLHTTAEKAFSKEVKHPVKFTAYTQVEVRIRLLRSYFKARAAIFTRCSSYVLNL